MGLTFNKIECVDPVELAESLLEQDPPAPADWLGIVNRYINAIGLRPGFANIILRRSQLQSIQAWSQRYPLEFTCTHNGILEKAPIPNMRIVGVPQCVSPSNRGNPTSPYLVELADRRIDCVGVCAKRYNWRIHPDSTYESESLNAGTAWTFEEIAQDLWETVGCLGTWPGFPTGVTVSETPEQIDGMGCLAAPLLEDLLIVHGMGIGYYPIGDSFNIFHYSYGDTACANRLQPDAFLGITGARLREYDDRRVWDKEPLLDPLPKLPQYIRVAFPIWSPGGAPIDTASYWVRDVADASNDSTNISSTFALIQDYMALRTNQQGAALNASSLQTRATAIAGWFFQRARRARTMPIHRVYRGLLTHEKVSPCEAIDMTIWEDIGGGTKTHVIQTGRIGLAPIINLAAAAKTTGEITTGTPAGTYYRSPSNQTLESYPIRRAGNVPAGETRLFGTGPLAGEQPYLIDGYGASSLLKRFGPLRQWDAAVQALSVDGNGQRLWAAKPRVQHNCWVRVTSLTVDGTTGYYPAIEVFFDPDKDAKDWDEGDVCWFWTPNSETPVDETRYWCYFQGSDGESTAKKVYMATPAAVAAGATELKGLTFTSDTGSTVDSDPGNGLFKWNHATQSSATTIYIDNLTADAVDSATFFASLGANGFLYIQQGDDSTKWQKWKWTAVTAGVGYYKFTVSLQGATAGAIVDAKTCYMIFDSTITTNHNLLSTTHTDTLAASPIKGDLVYGNSTPKWAVLAGPTASNEMYVLTNTPSGGVAQEEVWATLDSSLVTAGAPRWIKVSKTYADFSDPGTSKTINIYTLPAKATMQRSGMNHAVAWTGGTPGALTLSLDDDLPITGATYAGAYLSLRDAPSTTVMNQSFLSNDVHGIASATIRATLDIGVGNTLDQLTAGTVDFYFLVGQLP